MPDGQKVVQVPNFGNIAFPATMDDAAINQAISSHLATVSAPGAMQAKPGGPVFTSPDVGQPEPSFMQEYGGKLRDAAISASQTLPGMQNPSTSGTQNLQNIGSALAGQAKQIASAPYPATIGAGPGGPGWEFLKVLGDAIKGGLGGMLAGGNKMLGGMGMDPQHPASFGPINSQAVAEGGGQAFGNAAQLNLLKDAPEALEDPLGRESMQNLTNLGPAKANFIDRQIGTANAVREQIKPAIDAMHADGKQLMGNVSSHIDSVKPEGVFARSEVASTLKNAMGVVKDEADVPSWIRKKMDVEPSKETAGGPVVGGKRLDLTDPTQLKTYQKMKASGAFTPEEIKKIEGGGKPDMMPFEELKQIHSDLGAEASSAKGPFKAGVGAARKQIGDMLRKEADSAGMLDQWEEGRSKVKMFNAMVTKQNAPLKGTYNGANHGQIMQPLIDDKTGPGAIAMVESLEPYGIDVNGVKQSIGSYKWGGKWDKMSEPSRMTPILAAISPKMAALRSALPNAMRGTRMTGNMFPGSLEGIPAVKPTKIYPSKLAAAKELKGNPTPFGKGEE